MPEPKKRRTRNQQVYRQKKNAVHVTLYDLHGEAIPPGVRREAEDALLQLALENQLVINIATT